jgi:hypothetical protein
MGSTPVQLNASSVLLDSKTLEKGRKLQEVLHLFRQATTTPLATSIMEMPKHKDGKDTNQKTVASKDTPRKSPRLQAKNSSKKSMVKLAQDLLAKKCGIIDEEENLDAMTLQQYLDVYKKPLTEESVEAIHKLTEIAVQKKKKKKSKMPLSKTKSMGKISDQMEVIKRKEGRKIGGMKMKKQALKRVEA